VNKYLSRCLLVAILGLAIIASTSLAQGEGDAGVPAPWPTPPQEGETVTPAAPAGSWPTAVPDQPAPPTIPTVVRAPEPVHVPAAAPPPPPPAPKHRKAAERADEVEGYSLAATDMHCAASGTSLKGQYYRLFKRQPMTPLSFSASTFLLERKANCRDTLWTIFAAMKADDRSGAIRATLDGVLLDEIVVGNKGTDTLQHSSLGEIVCTPQNRGTFETTLLQAMNQFGRRLDSTDFASKLAKGHAKKIDALLEPIGRAVSRGIIIDGVASRIAVETETAKLKNAGKAFLMTRALVEYLLNRVHRVQRYMTPPVPSKDEMFYELVAILGHKAEGGIETIFEARHLENASLSGTLKIVIAFILFVILVPGGFYIAHKSTAIASETTDSSPVEPSPEPPAEEPVADEDAPKEDVPDEETPEEDVPDEETPEEEVPDEDTTDTEDEKTS